VPAAFLTAGPIAARKQENVLDTLPAGVRRSLQTMTGRDIIAHAKILSDPKFRGREASSTGAHKAARYIVEEFRRLGLRPGGSAGGYYQLFKIRPGYQVSSELAFRLGKTPLGDPRQGQDYMPAHLPGGAADIETECAFVGYGISSAKLKFDEFAHVDVKAKAVFAFSGVPWPARAEPWLGLEPNAVRLGTIEYKAQNAAAHGAVCLFLVDNPAGWRREVQVPQRLRMPDTSWPLKADIPVVHVTRELLGDVMKMSVAELRMLAADIARQQTPESMLLRGRRIRFRAAMSGQARVGRNIVAVLPGRGAGLKSQAVVVGAHYDHLGEGDEGTIYFGANDNAAGVGALLGVARAFAALPSRPRRTLVFVAFDAEEIGRRGSRHYTAHPAVPVDQTSLMVNFDMIGRNEPNMIYAVATRSSTDLHALHQEANRHVGLKLVHPNSFRLGLSDHSPFYYANVPIMYLFGGRDPDYNTPRDTWDRLIPGKVEKVARLAFLTAWAVAERHDRLTFEKARDPWSKDWPN
jgi:hypothetical protein